MSHDPVRVLLADDQPLVRGGFRVLIEAADDMTVVGEATTGGEAVDLTRALHPDVVLMDIRMPELDGLAATAAITADADLHDVKILILTTFEIDEYVYAALRAGASGFLGKGADPADLAGAIRTIHGGEALLSPTATRALIARCLVTELTDPVGRAVLEVLTDRERELMRLVASGLSNDDIAMQLVLSPHTVKTHINRAMAKLGAHDRAQLVIIAYETGLVTPRR
jgi:DNA-binding NarL/FixJ family response regulator